MIRLSLLRLVKLILFTWIVISTALGQTRTELSGWPSVQMISTEQGLPQSFVSGIAEDVDGFIWISTLGGLVRYDGFKMLAFPHRSDDSTTPSNGAIIDLVKAANQDNVRFLWLLHETNAVTQLNTQTGKCQRFPELEKKLRKFPPIRKIYADHRGNIWGILHQQGVFHYDISRQKFTQLRRKTHGLINDTINAITEDHNGRIVMVTPTGISLITEPDRAVHSRRLAIPAESLADMALKSERASAIVRDNGEVVVADQNRLIFIDLRRNTTRSIPFRLHPAQDLPLLYPGDNGSVYLAAGGALFRYTDQQGLSPIWRFTPHPGNSTLNSADPFNCTALCQDRSGILWMGANTRGLLRMDLASNKFFSYPYQLTFCADAFKKVLGLSLPDHFQWPFGAPDFPSSYNFRYDYDHQKRLWLAIGNEMGYYDFRQRRMIPLPTPVQTGMVNPLDFFRGLSIAPGGQLWVVSRTATPFCFDSVTRQWEAPFGYIARNANDLLADEKDVWVTTLADGLLRFNIATRQQHTIRFTSPKSARKVEQLLDLQQDIFHTNILWIGSYEGLIAYNKQTGRYHRFTTAQGLPDNTVYSILPDRQGYLWLSTNHGICRFDVRSQATLNFGLSDGLPGEEFNRFHGLSFPDGQLAFGGVKGWVLFDPAHIKMDTARPVVALTGLKINTQSVDQFRNHTLLNQPLNYLPKLELRHDQNYLSIDFAALRYHQPDRVKFRYQLQGYDADWTLSQEPTAHYTRLPPGTYQLRINAANAAGQWSGQIKELTLVIQAPFWRSNWAYALYTLLAGFAIFGLVRFRMTRHRERQELIRRQQQTRDLQQVASDKARFFANVSHELRTPLTLMLGPLSSVLNHRQLSPQDEQLLRIADHNAHLLLSRVRDLLDLTRLEANKLTLHFQPVHLQIYLETVLAPFRVQARQMGVSLSEVPDFIPDRVVSLDSEKLGQVLQNLLANACKFTPSGGTIEVSIHCSENRLQIRVMDNGRGIHPDDLEHIFERYFQTRQPDTPLEGGTGIGLALCQELVGLMEGTLTVASTWKKGSTFALEIPVKPEPDRVIPPDSLPGIFFSTTQERILPIVPEIEGPSTGERVLIVEDNPDLRTYLKAVLSPSLHVLTAAHGQEALALLANPEPLPSLLIVDIMMPVMDGFQLLETLKGHPTYRSIPVVMLTARADMPDKLRALRLGVDDYLIKPFDEAELMARVNNLLRNQRVRQQSAVESSEPSDPESHSLISAEEAAWLEHLEQLITSQLSRFDLLADDLADSLSMSRRTFYRTIKRLTGLTPSQYVTEARFREARRLLENRQVSTVKQAAYQVGFRQVSHFSRLYQQRFGKSPASYL